MYFCPLDELQGLILIAINCHAPASVDVESSQIWNYDDYLNLRQFKTSIVNPSYPIAPPLPPITFLCISMQIHVLSMLKKLDISQL